MKKSISQFQESIGLLEIAFLGLLEIGRTDKILDVDEEYIDV